MGFTSGVHRWRFRYGPEHSNRFRSILYYSYIGTRRELYVLLTVQTTNYGRGIHALILMMDHGCLPCTIACPID